MPCRAGTAFARRGAALGAGARVVRGTARMYRWHPRRRCASFAARRLP